MCGVKTWFSTFCSMEKPSEAKGPMVGGDRPRALAGSFVQNAVPRRTAAGRTLLRISPQLTPQSDVNPNRWSKKWQFKLGIHEDLRIQGCWRLNVALVDTRTFDSFYFWVRKFQAFYIYIYF